MSKEITHYKATLVRGETYYLGPENRFERGIPKVVSAAEMKKLKRNAVERRTIISGEEKEVDVVCKFKFEPVTSSVAVKGDKAKELAEMQGDGGVDFDEEDEDEVEAEDAADTEADEAGDEEEAGETETADDAGDMEEDPAPAKTTVRKAAPARSRRR